MNEIFSDFHFHFPAIGGGHGVCDVRVYASADGLEAVVLVIEDDRNDDHTSITNRATEIAAKVWLEVQDLLEPEPKLRWVEIYANVLHPEPSFDWMDFTPDFERVSWRPAWRSQLEALIGKRIAGIPDGDERLNLEMR